jgi:hypothetical protein
MSNTPIAWAAFYPVLSVTFGARPGGARKSWQSLDFPWPGARQLAARQADPGIYASPRRASSALKFQDVFS